MAYSYHFKPTHKEIKQYYEELGGNASHEVVHETAVRSAFQNLIATTCKKAGWHLVPELPVKVKGKQVRPDAEFHKRVAKCEIIEQEISPEDARITTAGHRCFSQKMARFEIAVNGMMLSMKSPLHTL